MLRARGPRAVHSGDEFESQMKEAFRKALEDHAKGDESDQQILGTSPLGPYLKKKEVAADTDEDDDDDEPAPARARRSDYSVAAAPAAAADAADAADAAAPADVPIDVDIPIAGAKRSRSGARVPRPARVRAAAAADAAAADAAAAARKKDSKAGRPAKDSTAKLADALVVIDKLKIDARKFKGELADLKIAHAHALATAHGKVQAADMRAAQHLADKLSAEYRYNNLDATAKLEKRLAVAQAKLNCGGMLLNHFAGSTSVGMRQHHATGTAGSVSTPNQGDVTTPQPLSFADFFAEPALT